MRSERIGTSVRQGVSVGNSLQTNISEMNRRRGQDLLPFTKIRLLRRRFLRLRFAQQVSKAKKTDAI